MLLISSAFAGAFFDDFSTSAYVATPLANVRAAFGSDAPVIGRLAGATRVEVLGEAQDRVRVRTPALEGWMPRALLTAAGGRFDLDGDGELERVAVGAAGGQVRMWLQRSGEVSAHVLSPRDEHNYAGLHMQVAGGHRMLRLDLGVDSCADYPVTWFTLTDRLRPVLRVVDWANGGSGGENEVTFRPDSARVRYLKRDENGEISSSEKRICPWDGARFVCPPS